jgi:hypothetical protein
MKDEGGRMKKRAKVKKPSAISGNTLKTEQNEW